MRASYHKDFPLLEFESLVDQKKFYSWLIMTCDQQCLGNNKLIL